MEWVGDKMIKEMVKGEKEKMLERNLYIHNRWGDGACMAAVAQVDLICKLISGWHSFLFPW